MDKEFTFTFGKHQGETLTEVLDESPSYVHWCACKIPWFKELIKTESSDIFQAFKETENAL